MCVCILTIERNVIWVKLLMWSTLQTYTFFFSFLCCYKKITQTGLKQQEFIFLWIWRQEVWNPGVSRALSLLKPLGKNPSLPPPCFSGPSNPCCPLVCGCITPISASVFMWTSSLCVFLCLSKSFSPYKDTNVWI